MKKIVIILSGAILAFACSKEDNLDANNEKNFTRTLIEGWESIDYEEYDYPENSDEVLSDYLNTMVSGTPLSDKSIEEAVWIIETGMNGLRPHIPFVYDESLTQEVTYTLGLTSENLVDGADITTKFTEFFNYVESNKPSYHQYNFSDITIDDIQLGEHIVLKAEVAYAKSPVAANQFGSFPQTHNPINTDAKAFIPEDCAGNSQNDSWNIVANSAFNGYTKTKYGSVNFPGQYTNVVTITSHPDFDQSKLLGNFNAVIAAHQSQVNEAVCITVSEMNAYASEANDHIWSYVAPFALHRTVTSYEFRQDFDSDNKRGDWEYLNVRGADFTQFLIDEQVKTQWFQ